jgi:predicted RND superfamily exporter protein/predicted LPLAT superfamily acyltransferase
MSARLKRWWWVLLLIAIAAGAWRLRFDLEILDLLPPDEPAVQGLKLYQKHFTNARELVVTVRASDADKAEQFAGALAEKLRAQTNLVSGATWQPPWLEQPGQLAEILACLWLNQPPSDFAALTNRLAPGHIGAVLAETREALATSLSPTDIARSAFDPFNFSTLPALTNVSGLSMDEGQKMFVSADGTFRLIFVQAQPELGGYRECTRWLQAIQTVVKSVQVGDTNFTDVKIHFTGRPVFVSEIAGQMQHDLTGSVTGTAIVIAVLFWLTHRRWLPLLWLLTLLLLILAATLALGGLILGTISIVSMGFAAILLGLAVDYAVVHYQEALAHPQLSVPEIRRAIAPSILWAAITTISAFLVLNFGGLPGLAQLGSLVAIGVALAALVMVMIYLPPLFPGRRKAASPVAANWWSYFIPPRENAAAGNAPVNQIYCRRILWLTAALVIVAGTILFFHRPKLDQTADALKPQHSQAQTTLDEMTAEMGIPQDALWVIISGTDESEVFQRLELAEKTLNTARSQNIVGEFLLPTALWPRPEFQVSNRITAAWFAGQRARLGEAALAAGFNTNALFLTDELTRTWSRAAAATGTVWPTNDVSQWLLKRFVTRADGQWFVMGLVYPATNHTDSKALANLSAQLAQNKILLSGWSLLGSTTLQRVQEKMWAVVTPMVLLVLTSLWLAFRRPTEIILGLAVLLLSGLCLLAVMALAGWSWNLLNLMSLPLLLGTGVDYGIFMQLALRRHGGDLALVRRSIGRALLLCGGTAIAGFGSLAWSGNAGMASLGKICATGIAANMLISIFLLPAWWMKLNADYGLRIAELKNTSAPSVFYRAWLWKFGLVCVRILPHFVLKFICVGVAEIYYRLNPRRREIVVRNLVPVVVDRRLAERTAHELFHQFAVKLAELWRFESGIPMDRWLTAGTDWDILETACARKRGVLLLTPHLGNWELGGALLARRGIKIVVLTQAEPGDGLTELRQASRARWDIETFVIGSNGFDFVEIIKRLQAGENVALLIDRPPEVKAVEVNLFGQPFRASVAAAELARASGCALLGVVVASEAGGYAARILPEFTYDRSVLGTRENRQKLTQQILSAFEPEIRRYPEQWFHFVPIWPDTKTK